MKARDVVKRLELDGWYQARMRGVIEYLSILKKQASLLCQEVFLMKSRLAL